MRKNIVYVDLLSIYSIINYFRNNSYLENFSRISIVRNPIISSQELISYNLIFQNDDRKYETTIFSKLSIYVEKYFQELQLKGYFYTNSNHFPEWCMSKCNLLFVFTLNEMHLSLIYRMKWKQEHLHNISRRRQTNHSFYY